MQLIIKSCHKLRTLTGLRPLLKMEIWNFNLFFKITIFVIHRLRINIQCHAINKQVFWNIIKQGQNPINITPLE